MKPGEKVRLIEECTDLLLAKQWPSMSLTLREFGFEGGDIGDWQEPVDYIMERLSKGPGGDLSELLTFLRGEDAQPAHRDSDQPWGDLPVRAFLSHIHEERHLVGQVKKVLGERYAIDAFVAHDDIKVSMRWREVIKAGLATCDMFVAFLHDGYHDSEWCDQEAGWALGRSIPIISVRPEGVLRRDGFLEEHQDFGMGTGRNAQEWDIARQVFLTAVTDHRTRGAGLRCLAEAFVNSRSFDTTRFLWGMIENVSDFDPEQLRRLEYAVQTNDQVYRANVEGAAVPDLVQSLVGRLEPPPPPPF